MIEGVALQLLPAGFTLPWLYLLPVAVATVAIGAMVVAIDPPITDWTVVAFTPWMALGAVLHVLYKLEAYPSIVEPLFGNPTVYLTTAAAAGLAWVLSALLDAMRTHGDADRQLGVFGTGFAATFAAYALYIGTPAAKPALFALLGLIAGGLVAGLAWLALSIAVTDAATAAGVPGAVVVFAHALDAVSTAVGYDLLGVGERTPLSRAILEFAASLPTADYVGAGWLFVLVKVVLALVIVVALEGLCRDRPDEARAVLGLVAAVGMGPAVHNLLLFTVAAG